MKVFRAGFGRGSIGEGGEGRSRALQIPILGTIKNSRHQILSLYQNACHFSVSLSFLNKHLASPIGGAYGKRPWPWVPAL